MVGHDTGFNMKLARSQLMCILFHHLLLVVHSMLTSWMECFFLKAVINKTAASLGCYLTPVEEALLCVTQWLLISFSVACVAHPVAG